MRDIMKFFNSLSIRKRLIILIAGITSFALIIGFTFLLITNIRQMEEDLVSMYSKDVDLLAEYSITPLVFADSEKAYENLDGLKNVKPIHFAIIFNIKGEKYASYKRSAELNINTPRHKEKDEIFENDYLHIFRPIVHEGKKIGAIYLAITTENLKGQIWKNVIVLLTIFIVLMFTVIALSVIFQKSIADPIVDLAYAMEKVTSSEDYSIRVKELEQNEIGSLFNSFNGMLDRIEKEQLQLRKSEAKLRTIYNSVSDVIFIHRYEDGKILNVNEAAVKMFGYTREEILKLDLEKMFAGYSPYSKKEAMEWMQKAFNEGLQTFEWLSKNKAGKTFWAEVTALKAEIDGKDRILVVARNINERKLAEEALKTNQENLQNFLDSFPFIAWYKDLEGRFIAVNEPFARAIGLASPKDSIGKTLYDLSPKYLADEYTKDDNDVIKSGKKKSVEEIILVEGKERWAETYKVPLFDSNGKIAGTTGFLRDITDRKKAEEELKLVKFAVDKAADSVFWLDKKGNIVNVNETAYKALGYSHEELTKMNIDQINPDLTPAYWTHLWQRIENEGSITIETKHKTKNGKIIPVEVSANYIKFGDVELDCAFIRDVSERKKAEYELTKAKNYIANIIDSMPSVLVGIDSEQRITFWNHKAKTETGIESKEAIGKKLEDVFPRFANEIKNIKRAIEKREVQKDLGITRHTGEEIRYEDITVFPLVANGVEGAVIRVDDKTEQKRLEEMMIQSEKMLSVGGLAAGMAHEINNPLSGILQSVEILQRRLTDTELKANKTAAEKIGLDLNMFKSYLEARDLISIMENIHKSGRRAAEIVKNMLSFARKSEKSYSSIDIRKLLDETILLAQTDYNLKKKYDFKQIRIIREYDENIPLIICESTKIQQVFLNLFKNGAEEMGERGTVNNEPMQFILRVQDSNHNVQIEVEDNGLGMNEITRRRVFEPFFTTKPVGQGTGLGLSVSYFIIVENHHGKMSVESEINKGTKFIIQLPAEIKNIS
jgi:PAS domain S-box-containing protein